MTADAMKPHPHGLAGRVADALDDLALLTTFDWLSHLGRTLSPTAIGGLEQ
jgi:hypothetical protein